jgi:glutathione S-transferase
MGQCLALLNTTAFSTDRGEYLKINPNGRIPALVDGDLEMFEAAAIILHLVDRHPGAGLLLR